MESPRHIIIVAGEASGDVHAAHLVKAIQQLAPHIVFSGIGGPAMQRAGVLLYQDLTRVAVVGFIEILRHLPIFRHAFQQILKKIDQTNAEAVILVDYPGFNLRLAKALRKRNIKIIYYISPQVWAWKESRVKLIKQVVDLMIVLFPFEKTFYQKHGMDVSYVGHPLIDLVKTRLDRNNVLCSLFMSPEKKTLGLLPGSRPKEIKLLLPIMIQSAQILKKNMPDLQLILVKAPSIDHTLCATFIPKDLPVTIWSKNAYDAIAACDACLEASGTATLETALLEKPMVVIYKTSLITWALAKCLIKIPYISLVNVVADKKIVPECIQFEATPRHIAHHAKNLLINPLIRNNTIDDLVKVKELLGEPGANLRAAKNIIDFLGY